MKALSTAVALAAVLAIGLSAPCGAEEMEAIKIELPEPFYGGTPLDYWGENLEPENYKDRPPFMAPKGTVNVALEKTVTSSGDKPYLGELKMITDGDKSYAESSLVELGWGPQWIQIDLEKEHEIYAILLWHYHEGKRVYFDVAVKVSDDPEFKEGVTVLFNNDHDNSAKLGKGEDKEYIEDYRGKLIDAKGVKGRYVRLSSNGNTATDTNHYVEVEVFGKPVK